MSKEAYESAGLAVESSLHGPAHPLILTGARLIDARGTREDSWILALEGKIAKVGQGRESLESALRAAGLTNLPLTFQPGTNAHDANTNGVEFIDATGFILTPGFIDIHSHGGWVHSFDDGDEAIRTARACHMVHGTTRQVLSLITNPVDTMCTNLRSVRRVMDSRPDVLGAHLEGPFIALSRKGAHDPKCLRDPEPAVLDSLLEAADGCIRQVTLAPERDHGYELSLIHI